MTTNLCITLSRAAISNRGAATSDAGRGEAPCAEQITYVAEMSERGTPFCLQIAKGAVGEPQLWAPDVAFVHC
jgi:hypothetical protein